MRTVVAVVTDDSGVYHGLRSGDHSTICGLTPTTVVHTLTLRNLEFALALALTNIWGMVCPECLQLETVRLRSIAIDRY